jgi:hypothetical protein
MVFGPGGRAGGVMVFDDNVQHTHEHASLHFSGGQPYSYCGINDGEVCCFVPENAEPVGILPTPTRSRCGKKGFDTGNEGSADMAEWPWHVST